MTYLPDLGELRAKQELHAMHASLHMNHTWKHEAGKLSSASLVASAVRIEKQLRVRSQLNQLFKLPLTTTIFYQQNKLRSAFSILPKELEDLKQELVETQQQLRQEIGKEKALTEHL